MDRKRILSIFSVLTILIFSLPAQQIDMDEVNAQQEFRFGVVAFHAGYYNKAVLSLEKSLALNPENIMARQWLARVFYQSGMVDAALYEWESILSADYGSPALKSFYETVKYHYGLGQELREPEPWVEFYSYGQDANNEPLFSRPTGVVPARDGSGDIFLVSFLKNFISRITPIGREIQEFRGGFDGFDHPFDILPLSDGTLLVSEFSRDTVSHIKSNGNRINEIGSSGVNDGEMLGPQFLCQAEPGFFFVSDSGNRRVSKYNLDGEFILNLGEFSSDFEGFKGPSGIAVWEEKVYVSDYLLKKIFVFDFSGNYLKTLINKGLESPEGLFFLDNGLLLIADGSQLVQYHPEMDILSRVTHLDGEAVRIIDVCQDENKHICITDFNTNKVTLLTEISSLYSSLFVRINRIETNSYPEIILHFTVEDRFGNPVVGLEAPNFKISESKRSITDYQVDFFGYMDNSLHSAFLMDSRSINTSSFSTIRNQITELLKQATGDDSFSLYSTDNNPGLITDKTSEIIPMIQLLKDSAGQMAMPDTAIRVAASQMLNKQGDRVIFFYAGSDVREEDFSRYGLIELGQYLRINGIRLCPVYSTKNATLKEYQYLKDVTGGMALYLDELEGLQNRIEELKRSPNGDYTLSYNSNVDTDFGRKYIPFSLEVIFLNKTGRDEIGFFAPGQF